MDQNEFNKGLTTLRNLGDQTVQKAGNQWQKQLQEEKSNQDKEIENLKKQEDARVEEIKNQIRIELDQNAQLMIKKAEDCFMHRIMPE